MNDDRPSTAPAAALPDQASVADTLRGWLRALRGSRNSEETVREALEELIEESDIDEAPIDADERRMLGNILRLRERTVHDVMVPRVDIVAVEAEASLGDVMGLMIGEGHSRLPVYRNTLDNVAGMVHIKDVAAWRGADADFSLTGVLRKILFVSPSMRVMELLLEMRLKRSHMALVVDEFGGIDGLVTIEDLVEEIVGEIEDEHDRTDGPLLVRRPDGTLDADARAPVEELETITGPLLSEEEREDIDTLGGLVFSEAGRVPVRGELIHHPSGIEFEVLDADPRRIKRLRVRGLPPMPGGTG
jgi:CBS domain containing-hemolysin-like protein